MLVKPRHAVVPDGQYFGKEREGPGISGAKDDVVDLGQGGPIDEVDGAGGGIDTFDGRTLVDIGVVEGDVTKIRVESVAHDDGVDRARSQIRRGEVVGDICSRDRGAYYDNALMTGLLARALSLNVRCLFVNKKLTLP